MPAPKAITDEYYYASLEGQTQYAEIRFVCGQHKVNLNMYCVIPMKYMNTPTPPPEYIEWVFEQTK